MRPYCLWHSRWLLAVTLAGGARTNSKKAIELAQAQETADQGAQQLQQKQPQSEQLINLTKSPAPQHGQTTCHRCGGTNHLANECCFQDEISSRYHWKNPQSSTLL